MSGASREERGPKRRHGDDGASSLPNQREKQTYIKVAGRTNMQMGSLASRRGSTRE